MKTTVFEQISTLVQGIRGAEPDKHQKNILHAHAHYGKFRRFLRILGPGVVTGAADDDPSGIATYSQTGAAYGYSLLWLFPLMFPLLVSVQETCSRIGAVTGRGLAAVIKAHYNKYLLYMSVFLVVAANVVNIGADLGAMAATAQLLVPLPFELLAVLFALVVILLQIFVKYTTYAKVLKWLALALFAYPITAFIVGQPWGTVLSHTVWSHVNIDGATIFLIVGIIGTTISPYLFFWDTSEVVEDEIATKRLTSANNTPHLSKVFMKRLRIDNLVGMSLASVTAWFIVIACASSLNASGVTNIETAADAAKALEPLVQGFPYAGLIAKLLFSVGIIGIGLLAVPVLAGSSSYAISEAFGWKEGLYRKFKKAQGFYLVIILATVAGLTFNFLGIDPIKALLFAAVFNGIASIPLLWMIARVGNNSEIMGEYKNGRWSNLGIYAAFTLMLGAGLVLLYSVLVG